MRWSAMTPVRSAASKLDGGQAHLLPGGWLLIEHGWDQGAAIRALFDAAGFAEVQTVQDLEQRDRITLGRRPA